MVPREWRYRWAHRESRSLPASGLTPPQPIALLARLGVDERHEGHGLGAALLLDVITQVASLSEASLNEASLSEAIGCRGLLVHAESEQARGFYEHLIPEFSSSPTDPLHLLLLKVICRTVGSLPDRQASRGSDPLGAVRGPPDTGLLP